jgi:hypothetical protein
MIPYWVVVRLLWFGRELGEVRVPLWWALGLVGIVAAMLAAVLG